MAVSFLLPYLISLSGWRASLRFLSGGILVVGLAAALPLRNPKPPVQRTGSGVLDTGGDPTSKEAVLDRSTPRPDPTESSPPTETRVCVAEKSAGGAAGETRLAAEEAPPGKSARGGGVDDRLNWSMFRFPYTWLYCAAIILASNANTFAVVNMVSKINNPSCQRSKDSRSKGE